MVSNEYMGENSTVDDLKDMAYTCCEGLDWYAKKKIYELEEIEIDSDGIIQLIGEYQISKL